MKTNNTAPNPWLLLEHAAGGLWRPMADSYRILAKLRGAAAAALAASESSLLDIHAGMGYPALAAKHFPDDPKGPKGKLKSALHYLRAKGK